MKPTLPLIAAILLGQSLQQAGAQFVPTVPARPDCTTNITTWFNNGMITKNGLVKPANSLIFDDSTPCEFHKWSWQMFLWLTSPKTQPGQYVFNSSSFWNVDENGAVTNEVVLNVRNRKADESYERTQQAGTDAVLMDQDGSLVYYGVHINDVYKYLIQGHANGQLTDITVFPTNAAQLNSISNYAANLTPSVTIKQGQALAMELKTSWVELSDGMNAADYITVTMPIPVFTELSDSYRQWNGSDYTNATLALAGFHVVGSAKGHPEMIWSTFEHINNAPNNDFVYHGATDIVANTSFKDGQSISTDWQFYGYDADATNRTTFNPTWAPSTATMKQVNVERMTRVTFGAKSPTELIVAQPNETIARSSTVHAFPWGNHPTDLENNTLIVSLNQNILGQLADGDVRKNYALVGTIWTDGGKLPGEQVFKKVGNATQRLTYERGSLFLANSTMETYTQTDLGNQNCFDCHAGLGKEPYDPFGDISHIYGIVKTYLSPQ